MKFLQEQEARNKINKLAAAGQPFLFVVSFDKSQSLVLPNADINPDEILFEIEGVASQYRDKVDVEAPHLFERSEIGYDKFCKSFRTVQDNISYGNSFLTNLTFQTPIETDLSLKQIYYASKAKYKLWLNGQFVLFSPESFIKIKEGVISSYPMKGTIDAKIPNAEQIILKDPKEMAEHVTIVDLIRNDLSMVSEKVSVSRFRYLDHIKTHKKNLLQVSSEIQGVVKQEYEERYGDLLFRLLPAGSITGAPKPETINIIQQVETFDRGFYTGVFGYFDGETFNSAVMIRFIEEKEGKKYFKSGGGITHFSDSEKEYQEYLDKIYLPIYSPKKEKLLQ